LADIAASPHMSALPKAADSARKWERIFCEPGLKAKAESRETQTNGNHKD